MMVVLSQSKPVEDSPLYLLRKKLSAVSRPFPPGFIPVVHPPPYSRSEKKKGAGGPIFLPADLRSPLPPSVGNAQFTQDSLSPFPSSLDSPASSQPRLMPSIKRLYSTVRLGHRQRVESLSNLHSGSPIQSRTEQSIEYNRPMLANDAQLRLRSVSTSGSKRPSPSLSDHAKHPFPALSQPENVDELRKKPSLSSKVLKKAKSVTDLRPERYRSNSLNSSYMHSSGPNKSPFPRFPTHEVRHEVLLRAMDRQVSSTKLSRSQQPGLPSRPVEKDDSKFPTLSRSCTHHQCNTHIEKQDYPKSIDLPYSIELESIEVLKFARGNISAGLESYLVSF